VKPKADFEPDISPPRSIRELVIEQLDYTQRDGKTVPINSVEEFTTKNLQAHRTGSHKTLQKQ